MGERIGDYFSSGEVYVKGGESKYIGFPMPSPFPIGWPAFALAVPETKHDGKHSLWTEWHGVSRYNDWYEIPEGENYGTYRRSQFSYWIRVTNETQSDQVFKVHAWIPPHPYV